MSRASNPLISVIRGCGSALWATFVLSLFINASMLVSPLYSMQVYDRVLTSRNLGTLTLLTIIVVAFLALYGLLEYARAGVLVRTALYFETALRRVLFETMLRAELSTRNRPGQQIMRDAELLRESIAGGTATILCDLPWMPVYVVLCFVIHPLLGSIALIGAATLIAIALLTNCMTNANVQATAHLSNEAHRIAASALRNGEVVRGLGMGDVVLDRWCGVQSEAQAAAAATHEKNATMQALTKFVRPAIQTALLCGGALLAIEGMVSPGAMLASSVVMARARAGGAAHLPMEKAGRLPRGLCPPAPAVRGASAGAGTGRTSAPLRPHRCGERSCVAAAEPAPRGQVCELLAQTERMCRGAGSVR